MFRLGMIGVGGIAARHLEALAPFGDRFEIVGHLGRQEANIAAMVKRFGGAGFIDLGRFIAEARPAGVIVTVPPTEHGPIEHALTAAGIPFLIEKPIGIDASTPERINADLQAKGLLAAVGYNWRAMDGIDRVRKVIATSPVHMALGRFHIGTPKTPWWRFDDLSGGQMLEQACHLVDLMRALLGEGEVLGASGSFAPLPEFADGDVAATSAALLRFGKGVPGVVTATCLLPGNSTIELRLICSNLEIIITQAGIHYVRGADRETDPASFNSYARQDLAFFDAVETGNPAGLFSSYADALKTHRLCVQIHDLIGRSLT